MSSLILWDFLDPCQGRVRKRLRPLGVHLQASFRDLRLKQKGKLKVLRLKGLMKRES